MQNRIKKYARGARGVDMLQRILPQEQDRREDCPAGLTSGEMGCASAEDVGAAVRIRDASFPEPFARGLEFNAPVHGAWNIVHVGMQVPECHQIYVCADNCMRGVVLTAAEMDAADRFSCVLLEEEDLYEGSLETVTIVWRQSRSRGWRMRSGACPTVLGRWRSFSSASTILWGRMPPMSTVLWKNSFPT